MTNSFSLTDGMYATLTSHLLRGPEEQVAFVFAEVSVTQEGVNFQGQESYLVSSQELLVQHSYHVCLTDDAQAKIIKLAWEKKLALVEFHTHTDDSRPAEFSPSDLTGLSEFVPHVRWRLRDPPYLAVVLTRLDFDALVWQSDTPEPLDELRVEARVLVPTGRTLNGLRRRGVAGDG